MNELAMVTNALNAIETAPTRGQIMEFQGILESMDTPPVDDVFPVKHFFVPNLYVRQMTLPKGGVVVGRIHKHAHYNVVKRGRCTVFTEFGKQELVGPVAFVSKPGTKRIVLVHEETEWATYHENPNNLTDPDELVSILTVETYAALEDQT